VAISDKSDPDVLAAVMTKVFKESDELPLYARLAAVQAVPAGAMFFCSYSPLVSLSVSLSPCLPRFLSLSFSLSIALF